MNPVAAGRDAGTTRTGRPSRRVGFEFSNYFKPLPWLTIDADLAFAHMRFRDVEPAGQRIPGAVEGVASLALAVDTLGSWFGALQLRYFGPRPSTTTTSRAWRRRPLRSMTCTSIRSSRALCGST